MMNQPDVDDSLQEPPPKPLSTDCGSHIMRELGGSFFTWADIAAICFVVLKRATQYVSEEVFVGEFFEDSPEASCGNPNYSKLQQLAESARQIAAQEMRHETPGSVALERFLGMVSNVGLERFGDDCCNAATPYWAIIRGIDLAYGDNPKFDFIKRRGPLNRACRDKVGVYLAAPASAMSTALSQSGLRRIPDLSFNNQLWYIHLCEKRPGRCLPTVTMTIQADETHSDRWQALPPSRQEDLAKSRTAGLVKKRPAEQTEDWPRSVRIGMAMFSPVQIVGVSHGKDGNKAPVTFMAKQGRALSATYCDGYTDEFREVVVSALDTCAQHKCHIVVFPEVVISAGVRQVIIDCLSSQNRGYRPQLVVAGSSWEPGKNLGDNISFLFDGYGYEIGRYYKFSPYGSFEDADHIAFVEGLDSPGKECTVVDIKGLGRVLPSICKDLVSDVGYTLGLAKDFAPNVVCTPALSPSMDTGFSAPTDMLSERQLSITVVCNQCGHMKEREGGAVVCTAGGPLKSAGLSSRTRTLRLNIARDAACRQACLSQRERGGLTSCVHIVDIDCTTFAEEGYISYRREPLQQVN